MIFGGGVPIEFDSEVIGAVVCSSGSADEGSNVATMGIYAPLHHLTA